MFLFYSNPLGTWQSFVLILMHNILIGLSHLNKKKMLAIISRGWSFSTTRKICYNFFLGNIHLVLWTTILIAFCQKRENLAWTVASKFILTETGNFCHLSIITLSFFEKCCSLSLSAHTVFENFWKKCRQFRCTSTFIREKFGLFYLRFSSEFNYLIQNLMSLGGDYMIPFCRDEILSHFARIPAV